MKLKYLHKSNKLQLILFMNGWACDQNPFKRINSKDYDVLMCYDYRDISHCMTLFIELKKYQTIHLISWSLGVYISSLLFQDKTNQFASKIAINGSLTPISDDLGIPTAVFQGTIDRLNERNRDKFFMRMCGGRSEFSDFSSHQPLRSIKDQKEELICLQNMILTKKITWDIFDKVLLSSQDMIFPFKNLNNAWADKSHKLIIDFPHFCFTAWNNWDDILKLGE